MKERSPWKLMRKRGFTLIETVLAIALCLIILSVIFVMMGTATEAVEETYHKQRNMEQAYYVLEFLRDDIEKSQFYFPSRESELGVVLIHRDSNKKYRYIYYGKKNESFVRKTYVRDKLTNHFISQVQGINYLLNNVVEFSSQLNGRLLEVSLTKKSEQPLKRNYFIRAKQYEKE